MKPSTPNPSFRLAPESISTQQKDKTTLQTPRESTGATKTANSKPKATAAQPSTRRRSRRKFRALYSHPDAQSG